MGLTAKSSSGGFTPAPEGTHIARCVQVIDLGTQWSEFYQKSSHKILIGWEIPGELNEGGEPFLIWNRYTLSLHDNSTLRAHLEAWRGKFTKKELVEFDLTQVLDTGCMVCINHQENNGSTYANVQSIVSIPSGMELPDRVHDLVIFDIDTPNEEVFNSFSDNLKQTINNSEERNPKAKEDRAESSRSDDVAEEVTNGVPKNLQFYNRLLQTANDKDSIQLIYTQNITGHPFLSKDEIAVADKMRDERLAKTGAA